MKCMSCRLVVWWKKRILAIAFRNEFRWEDASLSKQDSFHQFCCEPCWDLLQLLTRIRLRPWERFLQDLHQCNLQHRLNGCRWIIQLNWQDRHIASHNPMNEQGVSFQKWVSRWFFFWKLFCEGSNARFGWCKSVECTTYIQLYDELWWYVIVLSLQWLSTDASHTYSWQLFGTFVRTLGHRPLEYSRSLHIKGPKLCQVLFEILHLLKTMTPIDTLSKRRPSLCGFSKQVIDLHGYC